MFSLRAQDRDTDALVPEMAASSRSVPAAGSREAKEPAGKIQVVEKAENAKARIKKKPFPWLGVILGLAVAGGLVYYFLILKTTLHVDSDPPGAEVYLDGKDTAKVTPCELKPTIGAHQIKVSLDGYADVEREVVVKNGKNSIVIPLDIGAYTLLTPSGDDNVQRESPCLIRWDSNALAASAAATPSMRTMAVPRIDLELYRDDGKVSDIALGVPNSGTYTWNVPGTTAEGHNFKIQISCPGVIESRSFGPAFNLQGFREDFTDNSADFWLAGDAASWNVGGGYYSAGSTAKKAGLSVYDFLYSGSSLTVECKMRWSEFIGSNSEAPLFVMLGITNSRTVNSGYMLGYTIDGSIAVYKLNGYNFSDPSAKTLAVIYRSSSAAVNTGINNWNTVKVVRNGTDYALFINGTPVHFFVDSTYNPMVVMIGFGAAGIKTACDFDYVYLTVAP